MRTKVRRTTRSVGQARLFAARRVAEDNPPIEQLMLARGVPVPETEYHFARPLRQWRFDYAWPALKVALEIEGAVFGRLIVVQHGYETRKGKTLMLAPGTRVRVGGRHNSGQGLQEDAFKYNRAAILGWAVIRATTTMVRDGHAITELVDALTARGWSIPQEI